MKFEINRLDMLEAAKNAARVAPTGAPVDVLNGILIEGNDDTAEVFLTATNFETSIQQKLKASVEESGSMLMNPRTLVRMLSALAGEFVTFSAYAPNVLTVSGGKCVYEINCMSAERYPKPVMPFPEETVKLSGICSLAKRTVFAVAKEIHKPVLQCVDVKFKHNAVHAAACDGYRIMLAKSDAESSDTQEFLLPGRALQTLASVSSDNDVFEVGDTSSEIVFMRENMMFAMRKILGNYIDVNNIVKSIASVYTAATNANLMKEALDLITAGGGNDPVNLVWSDGQIHLCRYNEYSDAKTAVPANIIKDTPEGGFYYNADNLRKLFQVVDGRIRIELDAKGMMMVKIGNEVCVQVPQRAPVKKDKEAA